MATDIMLQRQINQLEPYYQRLMDYKGAADHIGNMDDLESLSHGPCCINRS